MGGLDGAGAHSRGDPSDAVFGRAWSDRAVWTEPDGGSGAAWDQRANVSSMACSAPGGRVGRVGRPSPSTVTGPRAGGGDRADAGSVLRPLPWLHGEAFPRTSGPAAPLHAGLHGDQAASASCRLGDAGTDALGTSQEAATPSAGGDAAASRRLAARLAGGGGPPARPGGDAGGSPQRALRCPPGGCGGHAGHAPGGAGGGGGEWLW